MWAWRLLFPLLGRWGFDPANSKDSTTIIPTQVAAAAPAANCASTVTRALIDCDMKQRGSTWSMAWRAVASSASLATVM